MNEHLIEQLANTNFVSGDRYELTVINLFRNIVVSEIMPFVNDNYLVEEVVIPAFSHRAAIRITYLG